MLRKYQSEHGKGIQEGKDARKGRKGRPVGELTRPVRDLENSRGHRCQSSLYYVRCIFMVLSARLWLRADGGTGVLIFFYSLDRAFSEVQSNLWGKGEGGRMGERDRELRQKENLLVETLSCTEEP